MASSNPQRLRYTRTAQRVKSKAELDSLTRSKTVITDEEEYRKKKVKNIKERKHFHNSLYDRADRIKREGVPRSVVRKGQATRDAKQIQKIGKAIIDDLFPSIKNRK